MKRRYRGATVVLGGGLTGLSAGYALAQAGATVKVFERDKVAGGLSRTEVCGDFRFDLGGHRFFTHDARVNRFVKDLLAHELTEVPRSSKIFLKGRYFDYPLRPMNALFGLGVATTAKIMTDYGVVRAREVMRPKTPVSLEDWVVSNFGRTMFNIYFRDYSEKVWGIDCNSISADWVSRRINGLSLLSAVRNAFFRFAGRNLPTLADSFLYPRLGIGRIAEKLSQGISERNEVGLGAGVEKVFHRGVLIDSVVIRTGRESRIVHGDEFVASIPLTNLVSMMDPAPPAAVLEAAARLRFRDIVIVTVMLKKQRVTDQTWIYLPDKEVPFGRIHEPTNWSHEMAPEGCTHLVAEYFSFRGDDIWQMDDNALCGLTVRHLDSLGIIRRSDVIDSVVVRACNAYPLFEVGYEQTCSELEAYFSGFSNLHMAGRLGQFRYYNMDHAISSGLQAADRILSRLKVDADSLGASGLSELPMDELPMPAVSFGEKAV